MFILVWIASAEHQAVRAIDSLVAKRRVKCLSREGIGEGETEEGGATGKLLGSPGSGSMVYGSLSLHDIHPGPGNTGSRV